MAYYTATGTGPVSFVDGNLNQQEIPLSTIFFTPNGVDASSWPHFGANATVVPALLMQLSAQGFLAAAAGSASTPPAMQVTAVQPGVEGNSITVTLANPTPAAGTVDVTVTATEVYAGLTPASVGATLGTTAGGAAGLVFVSDPGTGEMPMSFSGNIGAGPGFDLPVPEASDHTKGAFTLAATSETDEVEAQRIVITIAPDSSPTPTTFTLTASWTKTAAGVTLQSLETANPFAYVVGFSGQSGPLPGAGSLTLKGGAAAAGATAATAASASLLSGS